MDEELVLSKKSNDPWSWWRGLGSPVHVCSPMVDQSELAYRMLLRKHYKCDDTSTTRGLLCYTPMIHAEKFVSDKTYRKQRFATCEEERLMRGGLVAQFCGNDPQVLLNAAKLVETNVDAVDLNLGYGPSSSPPFSSLLFLLSLSLSLPPPHPFVVYKPFSSNSSYHSLICIYIALLCEKQVP
jgi:hypothetical protein